MKINQTICTLATCTMLGISQTSLAEEATYQHPTVPQFSKWNWRIDLESIAIDSNKAEQEFIKDSAWALSAGAEYAIGESSQIINFGFSFLQYGDKDKIKGLVERDGDISTEESDASAFILYADYGIRKRFGTNNAAYYALRSGYAFTVNSERSFANCSNCPTDDIEIDGGLYGVAGLGYNFTPSFAMELNFKPYLSGDLDSAFQLGFFWNP